MAAHCLVKTPEMIHVWFGSSCGFKCACISVHWLLASDKQNKMLSSVTMLLNLIPFCQQQDCHYVTDASAVIPLYIHHSMAAGRSSHYNKCRQRVTAIMQASRQTC